MPGQIVSSTVIISSATLEGHDPTDAGGCRYGLHSLRRFTRPSGDVTRWPPLLGLATGNKGHSRNARISEEWAPVTGSPVRESGSRRLAEDRDAPVLAYPFLHVIPVRTHVTQEGWLWGAAANDSVRLPSDSRAPGSPARIGQA